MKTKLSKKKLLLKKMSIADLNNSKGGDLIAKTFFTCYTCTPECNNFTYDTGCGMVKVNAEDPGPWPCV